jgi:cob(I)alamin adenosyltransferase
MVVLDRIYTRSGDGGTTSLGNGERCKKYDLRIDAYGAFDSGLAHVQNDICDVAADLCGGRND